MNAEEKAEVCIKMYNHLIQSMTGLPTNESMECLVKTIGGMICVLSLDIEGAKNNIELFKSRLDFILNEWVEHNKESTQ